MTKTIKEISLLWKEDKRQYVKRSTFSLYSHCLEKHILPYFGNSASISEKDVQAFVLAKLESGLNRKTVKDLLTILKMVVRYGMKRGMTEYTGEWEIKFPGNGKQQGIEVLSISNQRKIMRYIEENFTFRNLGIYICLSTGMRIGEVCALKWADINIEEKTITVNKTIERIYHTSGKEGVKYTELIIDNPKTRDSIRQIPMGNKLLKMVKPLKLIVNNNFYVLTNAEKPVEPRTYRCYYKHMMKSLGIPEMKFHGLRHTFATRCIESNCDYKTVSVLLGHANISTTLNLYVHPNMDQKKRCIDKMFKSL